MNKMKVSIFFVFVLLLISTACSNRQELKKIQKTTESSSNEKDIKYAQVVDELDLEGNRTFSEVLRDANSKMYYHDAYNKLINNDKIYFLETALQIVEYNTMWNGGTKFVKGSNGKNDDYINQFINQQIKIGGSEFEITPLKTLVIGKSANDFLNLSTKISQGEYFSEIDYSIPIDNKINIILGAAYQELFNIGDEFSFFYLATNFQARIIGFMDEGIKIPATGKMVTVDNYVIIPLFDVASDDETFKHHIQYYSTKAAGTIVYKTENEFEESKTEIEKIFEPYDLPYTIIKPSMKEVN